MLSIEPAAGHHEVLQGQEKIARGLSFHVDCNETGNAHVHLSSKTTSSSGADPAGCNDSINEQRHRGSENRSFSLQYEPQNNHRILENPCLTGYRFQDLPSSIGHFIPHPNAMHRVAVENQAIQPLAASSCRLSMACDNTNGIQEAELLRTNETVGRLRKPFKLFGVNLIENPVAPMSPRVATSDEIQRFEQSSDQPKTARPCESGGSGSVTAQSCLTHTITARSCTKVILWF